MSYALRARPKYYWRILIWQLQPRPPNRQIFRLYGTQKNTALSCALFVTIVSMTITPIYSFTGCVHGVKVECPYCGTAVQAVNSIGKISVLYYMN